VIVLVAACVIRGAASIAGHTDQSYASSRWEHSAVLSDVRALPRGSVIYTNAPDAVYLVAGRATSTIPETFDFSTRRANPRLTEQLAEIRHAALTRNTFIVYVRGLPGDILQRRAVRAATDPISGFVPSEAFLRQQLSLHVVKSDPDGTIYSA
jgi:hypothetical protein